MGVHAWRPPLNRPSLFAFTWHACVWGGLATLVWALSTLRLSGIEQMGALITLVALALVAELRPVVLPGNDPHGVVVSDAFVFAILYVYGIGPAVVAQALVTLCSEIAHRKTPWKIAFNMGQYTVSLASAWLVVVAFGAAPAIDSRIGTIDSGDIGWMFLTWVVYFLVNNTLVSGVSGDEGQTFREAFFEDFWYYVLTHFAVFVLSPVIALVALGPWQLLPLFLLPLFAVYKAAAISREKDHAAMHDSLTELPNRSLLMERLTDAIETGARESTRVGVLLLDLNRFKEVNDTLGHATGDKLLAIAASRIRSAVRPGDTVARLGGDEFTVVLPGLGDDLTAIEVAGRVRLAITEPFVIDDSMIDVDVSVGIAVYPDHGEDVETLLRHADVAMYLAKEHNTSIEFYRTERETGDSRLGMLGGLRRALDDGGIEVHFQPVVGNTRGEVLSMEAFARWRHPERGLLLPATFLPVAESSGLMHRLTRTVLDDALEQAAIWKSAGHDIPVAVNISLRDLHGMLLAETVERSLAHWGLAGSRLKLEVTESVFMADPSRVFDSIDALAELGVRLSLDDFGTGFASMVMLRRLPVDEVKIDGAFVNRITTSEDDAAIVGSIVGLAHALGLRSVAEGVESDEVRQRLQVMGCDAVQGWAIAPVMPADVALAWLQRSSESAAGAVPLQARPLRLV